MKTETNIEHRDGNKQRILITGASSGFGLLTAHTLLSQGHQVAASMRDAVGRNKDHATALLARGAEIVEIDVTNDDSVNQGVADAVEALGGLDVLINNAGVGVLGLQEAFTMEDFQRVFEINVFGVQRMSRAVLPYFRKQKSGLLVQISSILGRITIPFYGPYSATKWALEALSENYRTELSSLGVDVAIVEPGGFPTNFMERLICPGDIERAESYGDMASAADTAFANFEQVLAASPKQNPQLVADAIASVIGTPAGQRAFRTPVDTLGMGDHIQAYNEHLAKITEGIYTAFGNEGMLKLAQP